MTVVNQPNALGQHRHTTEHFLLHRGRRIAAALAHAGLSESELAAIGGWHPQLSDNPNVTPRLPQGCISHDG
jgi:hypothetical protein